MLCLGVVLTSVGRATTYSFPFDSLDESEEVSHPRPNYILCGSQCCLLRFGAAQSSPAAMPFSDNESLNHCG